MITVSSGSTERPDKPPNPEDTQMLDKNTVDKDRTKHIDLDNKYRPNNSGPYFVYIEHLHKNIGRLFQSELAIIFLKMPYSKGPCKTLKLYGRYLL